MLHLLDSPDAVRNISWKQLHEWVQAYPYAQSLRLIAARKAKLENNVDLQVLLELAATYAPSRRYLYEYLSKTSLVKAPAEEIAHQPAPLLETIDEEELAEITPSEEETSEIAVLLLETIDEEELAEITPSEEETSEIAAPLLETIDEEELAEIMPSEEETSEIAVPLLETIDEEETSEIMPSEDETSEIAVPLLETIDEEELAEIMPSEDETSEIASTTEISHKVAPINSNNQSNMNTSSPDLANNIFAPNPEATTFGTWLAMLSGINTPPSPMVSLPTPEDENEELEDIKAENEVRALAQKSVEETSEIISETLAKLLEIQGKHVKAIRMYELLSIKFPEKASMFAQRISDLRNK